MANLCPNCAKENLLEAKICERCGTRFMETWKMIVQVSLLMGTPILIIFIVKIILDNFIH